MGGRVCSLQGPKAKEDSLLLGERGSTVARPVILRGMLAQHTCPSSQLLGMGTLSWQQMLMNTFLPALSTVFATNLQPGHSETIKQSFFQVPSLTRLTPKERTEVSCTAASQTAREASWSRPWASSMGSPNMSACTPPPPLHPPNPHPLRHKSNTPQTFQRLYLQGG